MSLNTVFRAPSLAILALSLFGAVNSFAQCARIASPARADFAKSGGFGAVTVYASAGCAWTISTASRFVQFTSVNRGAGSGTVTYRVLPNPGRYSRRTTVHLAGLVQPVADTECDAITGRSGVCAAGTSPVPHSVMVVEQ